MAIAASPVERDVVWVGTEPSEVWRSGTLGLPGSRPADWRHCPRRRNGRFRRDRTLITFAGSRATRSSLNDSGSRSRPARSCPRSMAAAPGATALLGDRGTPTSSPFIATLPIRCASLRATDTSRATTPARRGARPAPVSRSATCAAWRSIRKPDVVVVSASSGPRTAYVAGRSDGRLYRRRRSAIALRLGSGRPDPSTSSGSR
jgi:hypothetical protein